MGNNIAKMSPLVFLNTALRVEKIFQIIYYIIFKNNVNGIVKKKVCFSTNSELQKLRKIF